MRPRCLPLGVIALALVLGGCITPSIPIPPPDPERMTFNLMGQPGATTAVFSYPPDVKYVGSVVYVYNRDKGEGTIKNANADGSVTTNPTPAALGDQMVVSFQRDDQTVSTCVRLREGPQSSIDYCDP